MNIGPGELATIAGLGGASLGALLAYARGQGRKDREHSEIMRALFGTESAEGMCARFERIMAKLENGFLKRVDRLEESIDEQKQVLHSISLDQSITHSTLDRLQKSYDNLSKKIGQEDKHVWIISS